MNSVRLLRKSACSSRAGLTDRSDYEGTTNYAAECSVREQLCCFFADFGILRCADRLYSPGKCTSVSLRAYFIIRDITE